MILFSIDNTYQQYHLIVRFTITFMHKYIHVYISLCTVKVGSLKHTCCFTKIIIILAKITCSYQRGINITCNVFPDHNNRIVFTESLFYTLKKIKNKTNVYINHILLKQ